MKNLESITKKYEKLAYNKDNYSVGGGLSEEKYVSNRHQDASNDEGKLTFGKSCQMFKKATGLELNQVKEVIKFAIPNMEWHHAGFLPKSCGGGMKKTYFLNSDEILDLSKNWDSFLNKLELKKAEEKENKLRELDKIKLLDNFLNKNAEKVIRVSEKPEFFYELNKEMEGKYGWFCSYGKSYNLPEYYTGWKFKNQKDLIKFYEIKASSL